MLRLLLACLLSTTMLGACAEEVNPAEQARIDAAKIAAVERASIVPPDPIALQKIHFPDYEANDLYGAGCAFAPANEGLGALALTRSEVAYIKHDDKIVRLAADKGGTKAPYATWQKYDGKTHTILLEFAPDDGEASGAQAQKYPVNLTIRNGRDQIVYQAVGFAQCGF